MADYAKGLRKLADSVDEAKRELNLAREQSTKPKHLYIRARRAAVQATRAVAAAVDLGFSGIWPGGRWLLSAMRNPDDPSRPPATVQVGERKFKVRSMKLGSGCAPDGSLRDDTALAVWIQQVYPVMHSRLATPKADAGKFNIPKVKTDDDGRILGRDGKPLSVVEQTDRSTGKPTGWNLQGPEARVTDDYDEADALEHLRCQAADWVDACEVAAELLRHEADETRPRLALDDGDAIQQQITAGLQAAIAGSQLRDLTPIMDEATHSAYRPGEAIEAEAEAKLPAHSTDFRSVNWFGTLYQFSPTQAACIRELWQNWKQGTPTVGEPTILEAADSSSERLRDVFGKDHPAWGTLIQSAGKGAFKLAEPEES